MSFKCQDRKSSKMFLVVLVFFLRTLFSSEDRVTGFGENPNYVTSVPGAGSSNMITHINAINGAKWYYFSGKNQHHKRVFIESRTCELFCCLIMAPQWRRLGFQAGLLTTPQPKGQGGICRDLSNYNRIPRKDEREGARAGLSPLPQSGCGNRVLEQSPCSTPTTPHIQSQGPGPCPCPRLSGFPAPRHCPSLSPSTQKRPIVEM